nr:Chain C, PGM5 peptide (465-473) (H5Y) [Homo sapiens]7U21_F Chain F, PGM5 peptide (465-473) (H5Y) [Homo sapiens]
AVGSYVYSV